MGFKDPVGTEVERSSYSALGIVALAMGKPAQQ